MKHGCRKGQSGDQLRNDGLIITDKAQAFSGRVASNTFLPFRTMLTHHDNLRSRNLYTAIATAVKQQTFACVEMVTLKWRCLTSCLTLFKGSSSKTLLCSVIYPRLKILCDAHPSSSRSDLKCMRSLVNYFRLLLRSGRRILFKMGENVTEHNNVFDELPLKRVRQESDTEKTEAGEEKGTEFVRKKKLKYALLLSYRGKAYHGMQINQETPTIEYFLFDALKKLNYISEEQARKPSCFKFQRAARTDKGVSAARQVCSVQLPLKEDSTDEAVASLNHLLPEDIRVMAIQRTTRGFDSKKWCDSRLYSYVLPAFCFAPLQENYDPDSYHLPDEILNEVNHILQYYVGTHNFFNFTSGKTYTEESSKRYIMECKCSRLAAVDAPEYLIVSFKGQSFLIHQIRKMIGLCISIVRGHCTEDYMKSVWLPERVRIPMAPALGLLLEEPYFTYYNQRFGTTHKPISWESVTEKCDQFREQYIIADMIETDKKEKLFDDWLRYLGDTFWKKDDNEDKDDDPLEADVTAKATI